jgi:phosphoglycolate phosphatase-like HAD superfamily hydrolase
MIKNILFDFDGVILDSMKIKGDGFIKLFQEYPKSAVEKLETYHYENGGVSRFKKINYFFSTILNKPIIDAKVNDLAKQFAEIIKISLYDKNNLIAETVNFIKNNHNRYNFHIVSGAENIELNDLCKTFFINHYFITINGSPTKKELLIKKLLEKYQYEKFETILIGDSINDYQAAVSNNIKFYGFNNLELRRFENYIETFEKFNP